MKILDTCTHILNREFAKDLTEEMLNKLGEMLNEYNIEYSFVLASTEEITRINEDENKEYCATLMYHSSDKVTVELVYLLWCKTCREVPDEKIKSAIANIAEKNKCYKLRFYKKSGEDKGNLDHEEFFNSLKDMSWRYNQVFNRKDGSLNPTGWKWTNEGFIKLEDFLLSV